VQVTVLLLPNEHCHLLSPDGSDVVPPEGEKQALISRILQLERLEVKSASSSNLSQTRNSKPLVKEGEKDLS
jgi:hypothetical protein